LEQMRNHATYRVQPGGAPALSSAQTRNPSSGLGPTGRGSGASQFAPRMSANIVDGSDFSGTSCLEIAQTIYAEQPIYEHARELLDHALFDAAQAGSRDGGTWDWEDYLA